MHEGDPRGQLRAGLRGAGADRMCTACHSALGDSAAAARHTHHDPGGAGARCVGCHMPRVVYGVLDVHRSHRIEIPEPARAAASGRPDACTGCHVAETPAWAAAARARLWGGAAVGVDGLSPLEAVLAGDAITRAVAADALGREQVPLAPEQRAARESALLEVMSGDAYPAIRHLAWRSLGRLGAEALAYDPSAPAVARRASVARLKATLSLPDARAPSLQERAREEPIEIGE
jgi:hypothetical protein